MAGDRRAALVWCVALALGAAAIVSFLSASAVRAQQPSLQERLAFCATCHGANGVSSMPDTPSLAGHPVLYTQTQLVLFREGQREQEVMNAVTSGMSDEVLTQIAEHYAKLPAPAPTGTPDRALDERGRALAAKHLCGACHLPDYAGREQMPRLAGQREDYLLKALRDYKTGARAGDGAQMSQVVFGMTDDDFKAVAHHIAHFR